MKARFLTLGLALVGLFTLTSSFTPANGQFTTIPLVGTEVNCTFTGSLAVAELSTDGGVIHINGTLTGSIVNTMGTLDTGDDETTQVNQPVMGLPVSLEGTTCTTLSLTSTQNIVVASDCGPIELGFTDFMIPFYSERPGGNLNLIYNSLCAIERWYENGNASERALIAHVNNFLRGLSRL